MPLTQAGHLEGKAFLMELTPTAILVQLQVCLGLIDKQTDSQTKLEEQRYRAERLFHLITFGLFVRSLQVATVVAVSRQLTGADADS